MELKVTSKKGTGFYVRAATAFLKGADAREAVDGKEAQEARPPVDFLRITALGDAIGVAAAVAQRMEAEGLGEVMKVQTNYPDMPNGRACSQMAIKFTGARFALLCNLLACIACERRGVWTRAARRQEASKLGAFCMPGTGRAGPFPRSHPVAAPGLTVRASGLGAAGEKLGLWPLRGRCLLHWGLGFTLLGRRRRRAQTCAASTQQGRGRPLAGERPSGDQAAGMPSEVIYMKRKGAGTTLSVIRHKPFPSAFIKPRQVQIWLPDGYEADTERHAVLYMHDGQNLFDDGEAAFGVSWNVADALSELLREGKVRKTIVVGINNGEALRFREYVPGPVVERLDKETRDTLLSQAVYGGPPLSGDYVRFLVEELKPFVDAHYRTKPDVDNTFIMGSSMGGLISWYTLALHPDVFGAAGCVSTHWPLTIFGESLDKQADGWRDTVSNAFRDYLEEVFPAAGKHRFWFDHGDQELDQHYEPYQKVADSVFAAKGYKQGEDLITKAYPGTSHNEASWRERVKDPLTFLLRK